MDGSLPYYSETEIVKKITDSHLKPGWNQVHYDELDIKHIKYENGKCNKCDRHFFCVYHDYYFSFEKCGDERRCSQCNETFK